MKCDLFSVVFFWEDFCCYFNLKISVNGFSFFVELLYFGRFYGILCNSAVIIQATERLRILPYYLKNSVN